jgi:hypothetical protein
MIAAAMTPWLLLLLLAGAGAGAGAGVGVGGHRMPTFEDNAVITLVTGRQSGYAYGALALGESLRLTGSRLRRIAMVTPDVDQDSRRLLQLLWELADVEPILCADRSAHFPAGALGSKDDHSADVQQDSKRFETTCTKFHAWTFTQFDRVLFMDSDLVILSSIDDALYGYSNASFVAAPECFPPDTINSGFMVFTPSLDTFAFLMRSNAEKGSAEGGDQGIYSEYLCPDWFFADRDDKNCGKLPWKFNVEAQYYVLYKNYLALYQLGPLKVIHYINGGKPWKTLFFDYNIDTVPRTTMIDQLSSESYVESHMYWRYLFLRASGLEPPPRSIYYDKWEDVTSRKGVFSGLGLPLFVGDLYELNNELTQSETMSDGESRNSGSVKNYQRRSEKNKNRNLKHDEAVDGAEAPAAKEKAPRRRRRSSKADRADDRGSASASTAAASAPERKRKQKKRKKIPHR